MNEISLGVQMMIFILNLYGNRDVLFICLLGNEVMRETMTTVCTVGENILNC